MHILLIYPKPNISFDTTHCIPLGLASIAAVLECEGHTVECVDMNVEFVDIEKKAKGASIVGLYVITPAFKSAVRLASEIKQYSPHSIIIFGGPFPSAMPDECLVHPEVDIVVIGEGEYTLRDICHAISVNKSYDDVKGVCFRKNNKVIMTAPREKIKDLDSLPFPAYHLFPLEKYLPTRPTWINARAIIPGSLITSRGCPFQCLFCFSQRTGFRAMSPERTVEHIKFLVDTYRVNFVEFQDDVFNLIPARSLRMCQLLVREGLDLTWSIPNGLSRVESVSREVLHAAQVSGCRDVWFAAESGSERVRNMIIRKGNTVQHVRDAVSLAKETGFDVGAFFVMGNPTETREEMQSTIDFACSLDVDRAQFTISTPFPGTELFNMIKNAGENGHFLITDFDYFGPYENKVFFEYGATTKAVVEEMYKKAYRAFYLRPSYLAGLLKKKETYLNLPLLLKEAIRFIA